jgi:hypothetical protein
MSSQYDTLIFQLLEAKKASEVIADEAKAIRRTYWTNTQSLPSNAQYDYIRELIKLIDANLGIVRADIPRPAAKPQAVAVQPQVQTVSTSPRLVVTETQPPVAQPHQPAVERPRREVVPPQPVVKRPLTEEYADASHPEVANALKKLQKQGAVFRAHNKGRIVRNLLLTDDKLTYNNGSGTKSVSSAIIQDAKLETAQWTRYLEFRIGDVPFKKFREFVTDTTGLKFRN